MATPARRTSKARKRMRRGHIKLTTPNLSLDPKTGEYTMPHHVSPSGFYKGRKVIKDNKQFDKTVQNAMDSRLFFYTQNLDQSAP